MKKNKVHLCVSINDNVNKALTMFSNQSSLSKSDIISISICKYLSEKELFKNEKFKSLLIEV